MSSNLTIDLDKPREARLTFRGLRLMEERLGPMSGWDQKSALDQFEVFIFAGLSAIDSDLSFDACRELLDSLDAVVVARAAQKLRTHLEKTLAEVVEAEGNGAGTTPDASDSDSSA